MKDRLFLLGAYTMCLLGIFVSGLLSVSYLLHLQLPCGGSDGCTTVGLSSAGRIWGVPVPVFGLGFYLTLAVMTARRLFHPTTLSTYPIAILGAAVSTGFTVYSIGWLHAACFWCIASNVIACLLALYCGIDVREPTDLPKRWAVWLTVLPAAFTLTALGFCARFVVLTAERFPWNPEALAATSRAELIPDDGVIWKGPSKAFTVVMFLDVACPACQASFQRVVETARRKQVSLVVRYLPEGTHPASLGLDVLAEEATLQGKGLEFLSRAMRQDPDTRDKGVALLHSVGLAESDSTLQAARQRVRRDQALGERLGLTVTPSIFVVHYDGWADPATPDTLRGKLTPKID